METERSHYDMVVLLHPTSPIRDPRHIDDCIEEAWEHKHCSVASACKLPRKKHFNVFAHNGWPAVNAYILNASIYVVSRKYLLETGDHVSTTPVPYMMDRHHSLDIDEEDDLKIAEIFLRNAHT